MNDEFYTSSYGISGSMMNLPTKYLKERKKVKVKVGDIVRCETEEFAFPFCGYIKKMLVNSAIVHIEHAMDEDKWLAKSKKI